MYKPHTAEERQTLELLLVELRKQVTILQHNIKQLEDELVQGVWTMSKEEWNKMQEEIDADPYVQKSKRWYAETSLLTRLTGFTDEERMEIINEQDSGK